MNALVYILLIGLALFSIVAVMVIVLREKRPHDAHLAYVRSPWGEEKVVNHEKQAHEDATDGEALATPITVPDPEAGTPAAHAPVTDDETRDDKPPA